MTPMDYDPGKKKWGDGDFDFKLPDLKLPDFKFPPLKFNPFLIGIVVIIIAAIWIAVSGFYKVNQ
ncbi:hypothetical protein KKB18_03995, partial [bacterium]|nr:hypothetical protein [bacterium]